MERFRGGGPGIAAAIFVRTNSGIDDITQLRGRSFAFGEPGSTSDLLARGELVSQGLRAADFLRVTNVPNEAVMAAVDAGSWDAGVAPLEHVEAVPGARFRILKRMQSPGHLWVLIQPVRADVTKALQSSLLSFSDERLLAPLNPRLVGFEPARSSDYDTLERVWIAARQFWPRPVGPP